MVFNNTYKSRYCLLASLSPVRLVGVGVLFGVAPLFGVSPSSAMPCATTARWGESLTLRMEADGRRRWVRVPRGYLKGGGVPPEGHPVADRRRFLERLAGSQLSEAVGTTMRATDLPGRHFESLRRRAELPAIALHDPRHTCATILLVTGKHPECVQELLGHRNISITLDVYSHVIKGMDGGLSDVMDEAL